MNPPLRLWPVRSGLMACVLVGICISSARADKYDDLAAKYDPHSIYLTRSPAHDLLEVLNDGQKFDELSKIHPRSILEVLKKFLNDTYKSQSTGLAFLHVDLVSWTAGFKKASDHNGTLTRNPWNVMETKEIAIFLDEFLNGHIALEEARAFIADQRNKKQREILKAWKKILGLTESPYVPSSEVGRLFSDAYLLIHDASPTDLQALKAEDAELYQKLDFFRSSYQKDLEASLRGFPGFKNKSGIELFPWMETTEDLSGKLFPYSARQKFEIDAGVEAYNKAFGKQLKVPNLRPQVQVHLFVNPLQSNE